MTFIRLESTKKIIHEKIKPFKCDNCNASVTKQELNFASMYSIIKIIHEQNVESTLLERVVLFDYGFMHIYTCLLSCYIQFYLLWSTTWNVFFEKALFMVCSELYYLVPYHFWATIQQFCSHIQIVKDRCLPFKRS